MRAVISATAIDNKIWKTYIGHLTCANQLKPPPSGLHSTLYYPLGDQNCFIFTTWWSKLFYLHHLMITNVLSLSKIKIVVCTIDVAGQPISRDRLSCATQARFMFVIDGDKNSFTTHAGIWPSKSDIEIELEEELILQKRISFQLFRLQ